MEDIEECDGLISHDRLPSDAELKCVDTPQFATVYPYTDNTNDFRSVVNITTGTSDWQRIGKSIKIRYVEIIGFWTHNYYTYPGSTVNNSNMLRCVLFHDKQPNVAPTWQGLFRTQNNVGGGTSNLGSPQNRANRDRYTILFDELIAFNMPINPSPAPSPWANSKKAYYRRINVHAGFTQFNTGSSARTANDLFWVCRSQWNISPYNQIDGSEIVIRCVYSDK